MNNTAKFPMLIKAAALAAAFSLQGAAWAAAANESSPLPAPATQSATAAPAGQAAAAHVRKATRGEHSRTALWVPGYGALSGSAVKALGLNEAQSKLLADAQAAQKDARKSRYEHMKSERKARFEQLKDGKIDPRAALEQAEAERGKTSEARKQITEKWFAVWDSLDATQQQKAATLLSERLAQRGGHMKHMKHMKHGVHKGPRHMHPASGGESSAS